MSCEEAEAVKQQYGCAVLDFTAPNSVVVLPGAAERGSRERPRRDLNLILEARARELFDWVQRDLVRMSLDQTLMGVVLSGGAARLAGLCDLAEQMLGCQARNGLPVGIQDWPQELDTPAWNTAAGLAMYAARRKFRGGPERGGNGFFRSLWG
jgi:cell division protein FtsA